MKRHRINSIITGLLLILFAAMLMLNKVGILTAFPPVKLMLKVVLIAILIYFIIVNGFGKRSFLGVTVPLGIIACLFSDLLGIGMVSPVTIILVSVLVGIGLSMIFGHTPRIMSHQLNTNTDKAMVLVLKNILIAKGLLRLIIV